MNFFTSPSLRPVAKLQLSTYGAIRVYSCDEPQSRDGRNYPLYRQEKSRPIDASRASLRQGHSRGRHRLSQPSTPPADTWGRPRSKVDVLVVVEGVNDMKAVHQAVDADVYVLGTATRAGDSSLQDKLRALGKRYQQVILLLDPDVAGRQARNTLHEAVPGCWHAFISVAEASAASAVRMKEAGDIGVEHASVSAIQRALREARQPSSQGFTRDELLALGLISPMHQRGNSVTDRRRLVCNYLGLGDCDGKQLLRQLNSYGFTEVEVLSAIEWANIQLQSLT